MTNAHTTDSTNTGVDRSVLDGLPVTIEAVLGVAEVTVGELTRLAAGDSFALDRKLGDAICLRLNGVTIAYGELVSVGDKFGVRITAAASK
jgi:flagellar motor switch protein FliN